MKNLFEDGSGFGLAFRAKIRERLDEIAEEYVQERKKNVAAIYYSEGIGQTTIDPKYTPKLKPGQSVKVKETGKSGKVGSMVHPHYYSVTVDGKTQTFHHTELDEKVDDQHDEQLEVLKQDDDEEEVKKKFNEDEEGLDESARSQRRKRNTQKMGRLKVVKLRVRAGKVQRRKKVSAVKGFTVRKGKLKRMSPTERRRRKMGARKAKFKRKGKLARIKIKMKRSLRKRKTLGL